MVVVVSGIVVVVVDVVEVVVVAGGTNGTDTWSSFEVKPPPEATAVFNTLSVVISALVTS